MRFILLISALVVLSGLAFSSIAPEYQCPNHPEDDCILCGGTPCFNDVDAAAAAGCTGVLWQGGSEGCQCFCPWKAPDLCKGKTCQYGCDPATGDCKPDPCIGVTCHSSCSGSTYHHGYCDSKTGLCTTEDGYCQYGCDAAGEKCRATIPTSPWKANDNLCEFTKGENCRDSNDCICKSGWTCNMTDPNHDEVGCAPVGSFTCNDGTCDTGKGENCASCNGNDADCPCGSGKTCDAKNSSADSRGCVYLQTPVQCNDGKCDADRGENCATQCDGNPDYDCGCPSGTQCQPSSQLRDNWGCVANKDTCEDLKCPNTCIIQDTYELGDNGLEVTGHIYRAETNGKCWYGACEYTTERCQNGCDPLTGACKDAPVVDAGDTDQQPVCQGTGQILMQGSARIYRNSTLPDGRIATWRYVVKNGDKYCAGDKIVTDPDSKVWIKYNSGRVAYVGPLSVYASGQYGKREVRYTKGIVQTVSAQEAITADEFDDMNVGGLAPIGTDKVDIAHVTVQSNVIFQSDDNGENITVIHGKVSITDPANQKTIEIGTGQQYQWQSGQAISGGQITDVDLSTVKDNIADMPGNETSCCPAVLLLVAVAGGAFLRRQPPG